ICRRSATWFALVRWYSINQQVRLLRNASSLPWLMVARPRPRRCRQRAAQELPVPAPPAEFALAPDHFAARQRQRRPAGDLASFVRRVVHRVVERAVADCDYPLLIPDHQIRIGAD